MEDSQHMLTQITGTPKGTTTAVRTVSLFLGYKVVSIINKMVSRIPQVQPQLSTSACMNFSTVPQRQLKTLHPSSETLTV